MNTTTSAAAATTDRADRIATGPTLLHRLGRACLYGALIGGALLFVAPLIWLVSTSLKPESEVFQFPPSLIGSRLQFENYPDALSRFPFLRSLGNTLFIVAGVEIGRLFSSTLAAFAFARLRFPFREPLFIIVLATMMLPYHVTLIPQYLMFRDFGWLNSFLPLIVPSFFGTSAFYIFLLRQFFLQIPREYDDAAAIDGCSRFGIFWRIALPLSMPAIGTVAIFTFMGEWNDYFAPLIYLNQEEKYPLALQYQLWQTTTANAVAAGGGYKNQPYNFVLAIAALVTAVPMVVFFLAQRYFIQGVVISGIKG
jgi:multiple sugar transport system permease protein